MKLCLYQYGDHFKISWIKLLEIFITKFQVLQFSTFLVGVLQLSLMYKTFTGK